MGLIPSFYQGKVLSPNPFERAKSLFGFLLLSILVGGSIYIIVNWQKSSKLFGFSPYKEVQILDLLSFGNIYNGKKVCTKGYYVQSPSFSILKTSLMDDEFTRSMWVDPMAHEIIPANTAQPSAVITTVCGYFESRRGGEFGSPPVWNHQLTVESFKTEGDLFSF